MPMPSAPVESVSEGSVQSNDLLFDVQHCRAIAITTVLSAPLEASRVHNYVGMGVWSRLAFEFGIPFLQLRVVHGAGPWVRR